MTTHLKAKHSVVKDNDKSADIQKYVKICFVIGVLTVTYKIVSPLQRNVCVQRTNRSKHQED